MSTTQADQPIRKFMFDRSFDNAGGPVHPARDRRPVTLSYEQLEQLKRDMQTAGFTAGKKAAAEDQASHLNATVDKIAATAGALIAQAEANRPQQEARLREAVLAIARKVLPDFAQRHGLQEIEAVVAGVIGEMTGEPRLVVRVNETQFDSVDAALKAVTEKQGYTGKVVLIADAEVKANDCRVEWADGGVEHNLDALWQSLTKTLAPGREQTPPPPQASDAAG
jgi:flagellar assembly protein FliH